VLEIADVLLAENATMDTVNARVADEQRKRTDASTRATQIRTVCASSKVTELADGFIASNMTVDAVKAQLTVITAKLDKVEIDNRLPSDLGGAPKAKLTAADIYAARNNVTVKQ
jgi:phage I-like protein